MHAVWYDARLVVTLLRWCRKEFGDNYNYNYAKGLWRDELENIDDLDLTDDMDNFTFELHCTVISGIKHACIYFN